VRTTKVNCPYQLPAMPSTVKMMGAETTTGERRGVVLILEFTDVPLPIETVRGRFSLARERLATVASAAEEDGEALLLQIGPAWAGGHLTREVEATLGSAHERGEASVVPLEWRASDLAGMFPMLSGDLELAPLGPQTCRLTLAASYIPPFGDLGRALDRALLHRVAQSTIRSFLARVATILEADEGREPAKVTA
jgi:hypothetical protein